MTSWRDLYEQAADRLAHELIPLLAAPESWMQRRVESVTVVSISLVRRAISIDMVLPVESARSDLRVDPEDPASPMVFPLGFLRKAQLIDFDLRERGSPLLLVRAELNACVAAALIAQEAKSDGYTEADVRKAMPYFRRIAGADRDDARRAFREVFGGNVTERGFDLARRARAVAEWLRDFYVLLIELPETGTRRRLVSFATDQVVQRRVGERSIPRRLGLEATPFTLDAPSVDHAASYHVEIDVPRGCTITSAAVVANGSAVHSTTQLLGRRAAIYPRVASGVGPHLALKLQQEQRYFFLPAAIISALIAVILGLGSLVVGLGGTPQTAASALLLSGLSVVTGLVLRNDEEPLTAELHVFARGVLMLVTVAALFAGTVIALGAHNRGLGIAWTAAFVVAAAGAATLSLGAFRAANEQIGSVMR
jgi:hypothetical protein